MFKSTILNWTDYNTIKQSYPLLNFDFNFICTTDVSFIRSHLLMMGFTDSDDEIQRLK